MGAEAYWSVEDGDWRHGRSDVHWRTDLYWSVERCRWEPVGPAADALATPWSRPAAAAPPPSMPEQRPAAAAPVDA